MLREEKSILERRGYTPPSASLRSAPSPKGQARKLAERSNEQLTYRVRNSNFSK